MANHYVKLQVQVEMGQETLIDSYKAKSWDDFVLISLNVADPNTFNEIANKLSTHEKLKDKVVLLFPPDIDMIMYGIEVDDDETTDQAIES